MKNISELKNSATTQIGKASKDTGNKVVKDAANKTSEHANKIIGQKVGPEVFDLAKSVAGGPEAQLVLDTLNEALDIYSKLNAEIPAEILKQISAIEDPTKLPEIITKALKEAQIRMKNSQIVELIDIKSQHYKSISAEQIKKQKVLDSLKQNVQKVREITNNELKEIQLAENSQDNLQGKLAGNQTSLIENSEMKLGDITEEFIQKQKDLTYDGREQIASLKHSNQATFQKKATEWDEKHMTQKDDHDEKMRANQQNYITTTNKQNATLKSERMTANIRQQAELNKIQSSYDSFKLKNSEKHKNDLIAQEKTFEKNFAEVKTKHELEMQKLNERNKKVLTEAKSKNSQSLNTYSDQTDDPFYQFTDLNPRMSDKLDHIQVDVPVPEHSAKDLLLTINNKDIVLTANRRYVDTMKDGDSEKKINKVESLTNRLHTDYKLDPKSVQSKYEGGVMSYTIKKT